MEYYMAIKKKELLPFFTAWMDFAIIMLTERSQSEKYKYHMCKDLTYMWNLTK